MKKLFAISFGILATASLLIADASSPVQSAQTGKMVRQEVDLNKFQNSEVLKLAVKELSKDLPRKIDAYTTLVNVRKENLTLVYVYEINTGAKSDEAVRKEDHERMRLAVTDGTCRTSKRFLDSGISISYLYNSAKSKKKLFQFDISRKECHYNDR
ncbi:MAG: hypothetical protein B5M52_00625 [Helicobacteraceae bacterium 4484_230]|nr:MAG: hypothetical protein B5M52_00625 [Helicobacteraceae bacterium 4484_230]